MSTINPASLYSQNQGIFNARPYVWHEEQLQAHQDAKDDALNEYYKNLPNTINDKGLRDIDVPGVNEARNALSQNFIQNKKNILKGNTPESYNYQKQVRDLQGKVQEGLNASQISTKIGALKTDPNKSYMFQSDDKMKQIVDHNLSVFDKDRQGINLTNFTADPKPFNLNDYQKEFKDIKPDIVKTYEPIKNTNLTVTEIQTPKFTEGDLNNIHKRATNRIYTDPTFIPHIKGWLAKNPDQLPVLDQTFQKSFGHPMAEGSEGDIATAYTLMGMDMTSKSTPVPNVQGIYNQKRADKKEDAARTQGYKQSNILLNKNNSPQESSGNSFDEINGFHQGTGLTIKNGVVRDKEGKLYSGNKLELEKEAMPSSMISNLKKNGLKPEKIDKLKLSVVDGQIVNGSSDETGTITRQNMENLQNNKVPKTAVPAKYGNTKATVPVQQKAPTTTNTKGKIR